MPAPSLADREHAAYIHGLGIVAESAPRGWVRRFGGVVAVVAHSPIPLFNHVFIESSEATRGHLETAMAVLEETGLTYTVSFRGGTDDRMAEVLEGTSLVPADKPTPGMALRPLKGHETPPSLEIRAGADVFGDHCVAAADGFGLPVEIFHDLLTRELVNRDDVVFYAGFVDGEVVASSCGILHDSSVTVFNVATLPEHRGRGYGGAMTMAAVFDGGEKGCDAAFLQSSAMGFGVYRRLGFETVVEYNSSTSRAPETSGAP